MQEREQSEGRDRSLSVKLTVLFAVAAIVIRLVRVRQMANITAVGALGLFGGSRLRSWIAFLIPLAVMAASDVFLNLIYGDHPFNPYVYGCYLLNVLWGWLLLGKITALRVGSVSVLSSVQFYLITNLGVWLGSHGMTGEYEKNLSGLLMCYVQAIPFFFRTLMGDLGFSALFFGLYAWAQSTQRATAPVKETA
jgi:hypothetical protein